MAQSASDVALDHQAQTQQVVDATAALAQQAWDQVDPNNIVNSYAEQLPGLTVTVSAGQRAAAAQADAYLDDVLGAQDLATRSVGAVDPAGFAGVASDGGMLMSLLTNPALVALGNIQTGYQVLDAMLSARSNLDMIVRTQVADAGRLADQASLIAHPGADGYTRIAVGGSCSRCLILAGKFYRWNTGFARHPRCDCKHVPTRQAKIAGLIQDPMALYERMSVRQRLRAGFSFADQESIRLGADLNQVVNARRGVYLAGGRRLTREGTTRRGLFGGYEILDDGTLRRRAASEFGRAGRYRRTTQERLTPDQIFAEAGSREEAVQMLRRNGYLFGEPAVQAQREVVNLASTGAGTFAEPAAAVQVRAALAAAQTPAGVSRALEAEFRRITDRDLAADFSGSVETAREHAEGILRAAEQHPDIRLSRVSTGRMAKSKSYAETYVGEQEIVFSDRWSSVERRQDYLEALAGDERAGWHPAGTGNPAGVAAHEMGHLFDVGSSRLDEDVARLLFGLQQQTGVQLERAIRLGVSEYATTSRRELLAEAFSDVTTNGERASGLSRALVRSMEEHRGANGGVVVARGGPLPSAPRPASLAALRKQVVDAGITVPTGAPRAVVENLVDALERGVAPARAREAVVRELGELRGMVGAKLSDVAKALEAGASDRAMGFYARQLRRLSSGEGGVGFPARAVPELGKPLQDLIAALERGDAAAAKAALPKAVTGSKLKAIGAPEAVVSRSALGDSVEWVGAGRGDVVEVLQPGYSTTLDGRAVVVSKPSIRAASTEQAQAFRAAQPVKRARAKKAAPAKKAAAPRVQAKPAPERMSLPALKTEVQTAVDRAAAVPGVQVRVPDLASVPKPVLAEWTSRARTMTDRQLAEEVGRWRQVVIDRRRATAEMLAEADQLLDAGADAATLAARAARRVRDMGDIAWPDLAEAKKLAAAMATGDARKIRAAVKAAQRKLGLEQIGADAGTVARYDRTVMSPIGGKIPADAHVVVVRPGYRMADGTVLSKPVVEEVDDLVAIDRSLSPAEVIRQETQAHARALAAPPVKLEELAKRSPGGADTRALYYYQRHGDVHMNGLLRRGKVGHPAGVPAAKIPPAAEVERSIARIDRLMEQSQLAEPVTVYRGMSQIRRIFGSRSGDSLVGRTFRDRGFVSTSASRREAQQFMAGEGRLADGALLEIRAPAGTGAIQVSNETFMGRAPSVMSEQEILLQRGLRFRVISDEVIPDVYEFRGEALTNPALSYRHIVVEVIP